MTESLEKLDIKSNGEINANSNLKPNSNFKFNLEPKNLSNSNINSTDISNSNINSNFKFNLVVKENKKSKIKSKLYNAINSYIWGYYEYIKSNKKDIRDYNLRANKKIYYIDYPEFLNRKSKIIRKYIHIKKVLLSQEKWLVNDKVKDAFDLINWIDNLIIDKVSFHIKPKNLNDIKSEQIVKPKNVFIAISESEPEEFFEIEDEVNSIYNSVKRFELNNKNKNKNQY